MDFEKLNYPTNEVTYKNEDSFLRRLAVGISSYMYDTLYMPVLKDDNIQMIHVPIYYSLSGDYQSIIDIFIKSDDRCDELCIAEGNINKIPSGVFTFGSMNIDRSQSLSMHERGNFYVEVNDDFGGTVTQNNSTARFIDIQMPVTIKFRSSTNSERFKLWECFIRTYYDVRKFFIRYGGIEKIPVMLKFPDGYDSTSTKLPSFPVKSDQSNYEMEVSIDVYTIFPIIDPSRLRNSNNRMTNTVIK